MNEARGMQLPPRNVIFTCFVGRRKNLEILFQYVAKLRSTGMIDSVHLWDFIRDPDDKDWIYTNAETRGFEIKKPDSSNYKEYYSHYTSARYPNSVVIKSDDDIVFVDVGAFAGFLAHRLENAEPLLLFPSIVNNGVCAYRQQSCGVLPPADAYGGVSFEDDHGFGSLWASGEKAQTMHAYFLDHYDEWIAKSKACGVVRLPVGQRVSINFFAVLSEDLDYAYGRVTSDDEYQLTVTIPNELGRRNEIYMGMTVSHLSFFKQRDTGMDEALVLERYRAHIPRALAVDDVREHFFSGVDDDVTRWNTRNNLISLLVLVSIVAVVSALVIRRRR